MVALDEFTTFCKKKGFVYPNSEIYGGLAGFFDYGPLGTELKNNIKKEWWKTFVQSQDNVFGIDGSIISHPKVWQASGHTENFNDVFLECSKCHSRTRADHFIEDHTKIDAEGLPPKQIDAIIKKHKLKCSKCKSPFNQSKPFNLMFETYVGPVKKSANIAYLRPETAQLIFTNFKNIVDTQRVKLPFGIAQIGKAFRNEISPRDFLFRLREFEQMEMEFFTHPSQTNDCPLIKPLLKFKVNFLAAKSKTSQAAAVKQMLDKKLLTQWHAYWLIKQYQWFLNLGINPKNLRIREHRKDELSHYAKACFDIEYNFPFGWKEIHGNADRGQFDLTQHQKHSQKSLTIYNEETKEKVLPAVASEPSQGIDRAFLAFLFDAYHEDKKRGNIVLKLSPKLAPFFCAVFPLVKNKPSIVKKAQKIYRDLKDSYPCFYNETASVGRRYARADEIGVLYTLTIDFDTLKDNAVTVRDIKTTKQTRVKISELKDKLFKLYFA
jgi:glycyl-tRNA synthetase